MLRKQVAGAERVPSEEDSEELRDTDLVFVRLDRETEGPFAMLDGETHPTNANLYIVSIGGSTKVSIESHNTIGHTLNLVELTARNTKSDLSEMNGAPVFTLGASDMHQEGRNSDQDKSKFCGMVQHCRVYRDGVRRCIFMRVMLAWRRYRCMTQDSCGVSSSSTLKSPEPSPSEKPMMSKTPPYVLPSMIVEKSKESQSEDEETKSSKADSQTITQMISTYSESTSKSEERESTKTAGTVSGKNETTKMGDESKFSLDLQTTLESLGSKTNSTQTKSTTIEESESVEPTTTIEESESVEPTTTIEESESVEPTTTIEESESVEPITIEESESVEPTTTIEESESVEPITIEEFTTVKTESMKKKEHGTQKYIHPPKPPVRPLVLLELGADIELRNKDERTALYEAVAYDSINALNILLAYDAKIDAKGKEGLTPLMNATIEDDEEMVKTLIHYGANVDAQDAELGNTPLHFAAENGSVNLIKILLNAGGSQKILNKNSETPEDVICRTQQSCSESTKSELISLLNTNTKLSPDISPSSKSF
eukprot:g5128.t1